VSPDTSKKQLIRVPYSLVECTSFPEYDIIDLQAISLYERTLMFEEFRKAWDRSFGTCVDCQHKISSHHSARRASDDIGNEYFGCQCSNLKTREDAGVLIILGTTHCTCKSSRSEATLNSGVAVRIAGVDLSCTQKSRVSLNG